LREKAGHSIFEEELLEHLRISEAEELSVDFHISRSILLIDASNLAFHVDGLSS
jgi:hypothetical protein